MKVRVLRHKVKGSKKWAIDYRDPTTGKRKYKSFPTKREAEREAKRL